MNGYLVDLNGAFEGEPVPPLLAILSDAKCPRNGRRHPRYGNAKRLNKGLQRDFGLCCENPIWCESRARSGHVGIDGAMVVTKGWAEETNVMVTDLRRLRMQVLLRSFTPT